MPIYQFKCKCGHEVEEYFSKSIDSLNREIPMHCNKPMSQVFKSAPHLGNMDRWGSTFTG